MADDGGPPTKRQLMDTNNEDQQSSGISSHHHGGGGGSESGSGITIMRPLSTFQKGKLTFFHTRFLTTNGYQFKGISFPGNDGDTSFGIKGMHIITTPYAAVPVEVLPWYMTENEYDNLPYDCTVKRVATVCTPLGYRTPFTTNSAQIGSVNSNFFVLAMCAHGLNNRYNGLNLEIKAATDKPMIPQSATFANEDDWKAWYGDVIPSDNHTPAFETIPCCFGNTHPLKRYFCHAYDNKKGGPLCPDLLKHITIHHFENSTANHSHAWEYRPQVSVLNPSKPIVPFRGTYSKLNLGVKIPCSFDAKIEARSDCQTTISGATALKQEWIKPTYYSYIEQAGSVSRGWAEPAGGVAPPSLHVGLLPTTSWSANFGEEHVMDVTAIYRFDTSIEIEYSYESLYPHHQIASAHKITSGDNKYLQINQRICHMYGYKGKWDERASTA